MNEPTHINRCDDGGAELLGTNADEARMAAAILLAEQPDIARPLLIALLRVVERCKREHIQPRLIAHGGIGFVYFGLIDMAQAQQQRAKL
jgi:hypothetical protein